MWEKVHTCTVAEFTEYLMSVHPQEIHCLRFVYTIDNIIYLATFENFGEVMPDNMALDKKITVYRMEEKSEVPQKE